MTDQMSGPDWPVALADLRAATRALLPGDLEPGEQGGGAMSIDLTDRITLAELASTATWHFIFPDGLPFTGWVTYSIQAGEWYGVARIHGANLRVGSWPESAIRVALDRDKKHPLLRI